MCVWHMGAGSMHCFPCRSSYHLAVSSCFFHCFSLLRLVSPLQPAMQWARSKPPHATGFAAKRKLPPLSALNPSKQPRPTAAQAAAPAPGGGDTAAAQAVEPVAADPASPAPVDVESVAAKHGWDLSARNDWSHDKQVKWLPVAAIRRPLQGSRSNGEVLAESTQSAASFLPTRVRLSVLFPIPCRPRESGRPHGQHRGDRLAGAH